MILPFFTAELFFTENKCLFSYKRIFFAILQLGENPIPKNSEDPPTRAEQGAEGGQAKENALGEQNASVGESEVLYPQAEAKPVDDGHEKEDEKKKEAVDGKEAEEVKDNAARKDGSPGEKAKSVDSDKKNAAEADRRLKQVEELKVGQLHGYRWLNGSIQNIFSRPFFRSVSFLFFPKIVLTSSLKS